MDQIKKSKLFNLYLMGYKGLKSLNYLIENKKDLINCVCTSRDLNLENDYFDEIIELCANNKIKYFTRNDSNNIPTAPYFIAISWRWLISTNAILIVLHDSILPKYRGFLPLVTQLIEGEKELGVSAIIANDSYDEGDIIHISRIKIDYPITIKEAIEKISFCYLECIKTIVDQIESNQNFELIKQQESEASYSLWRNEDDYYIDWALPVKKICRTIDALGFPYKGAKTYLENEEVIIDKVCEYKNLNIHNRDLGKILFLKDSKPIIVCKDGLIEIKSARYIKNNKTIFPLKKFRMKFK